MKMQPRHGAKIMQLGHNAKQWGMGGGEKVVRGEEAGHGRCDKVSPKPSNRGITRARR